jgi:hypothetical protein
MIIYLCAFINKYYIEEAMVCIQSIRTNGKFTGDIYLFTDMDVLIDNVKIIKTTVKNVKLSASYRLRVFEHIMLSDVENETILYLDTDIVVLNEILPFDNINDKIQMYGYLNRKQTEKSFAGLITNDKMYTMKPALCSGILLFRASNNVKKVFDESYELYLELIDKKKVNGCWEQPALCYTLTKLDMCEMSLNAYVHEERTNQVIKEDVIFNHFCGLRGDERYIKMLQYLQK